MTPRTPRRRQTILVGQKIRQIRKERGLTQAELAQRIGVQQSDLCRMENGEYKVALDTLFRVLGVFGIAIGEFRHEWGASPQGATYVVESMIGVDWPLVGPWVNALLRRFVFSEGMLREWKRHQVEEVGLLPHFLPQLYAQRNDSNIHRLS